MNLLQLLFISFFINADAVSTTKSDKAYGPQDEAGYSASIYFEMGSPSSPNYKRPESWPKNLNFKSLSMNNEQLLELLKSKSTWRIFQTCMSKRQNADTSFEAGAATKEDMFNSSLSTNYFQIQSYKDLELSRGSKSQSVVKGIQAIRWGSQLTKSDPETINNASRVVEIWRSANSATDFKMKPSDTDITYILTPIKIQETSEPVIHIRSDSTPLVPKKCKDGRDLEQILIPSGDVS